MLQKGDKVRLKVPYESYYSGIFFTEGYVYRVAADNFGRVAIKLTNYAYSALPHYHGFWESDLIKIDIFKIIKEKYLDKEDKK